MGNNEGYNASDGSQRGSQAALLAVTNERHRWPKGKDFLFSTWAFVVGKNNLTYHYFISIQLTVWLILWLILLSYHTYPNDMNRAS